LRKFGVGSVEFGVEENHLEDITLRHEAAKKSFYFYLNIPACSSGKFKRQVGFAEH
jgi:hypothetical protein